MIIWAVAATAACIVLIIMGILVVRQINEICRRLAFIRTHRTNMRLSGDLPFKAAGRLMDEINALLDGMEEERIRIEQESRGLKKSLTGISHDIRTPLTSLSGYFQLLSETENPRERERYERIIRARIDGLGAMLEELFTYTKLQDDEYKIEMGPLDFTRCAVDATLAFYGQFMEKGIKPEVKIPEEPAVIYGNPEAVRRILQNIIKNALVHGTDQVAVTLEREEGKAILRCSNSCENPEKIDMEGVFTRFYQADAARRDGSTGLGLTIASELVKRLGGELTAKLTGDIFTVIVMFPLFAAVRDI